MADDEGLAERVRAELAIRTEFSELKMFGGLAFMADWVEPAVRFALGEPSKPPKKPKL
jgi:hypothetical protein